MGEDSDRKLTTTDIRWLHEDLDRRFMDVESEVRLMGSDLVRLNCVAGTVKRKLSSLISLVKLVHQAVDKLEDRVAPMYGDLLQIRQDIGQVDLQVSVVKKAVEKVMETQVRAELYGRNSPQTADRVRDAYRELEKCLHELKQSFEPRQE